MRCMTGVSQRSVDDFDIVLIFGQHGNRYTLMPVQIPFPGIGEFPMISIFC
jgi:hypothetical protein